MRKACSERSRYRVSWLGKDNGRVRRPLRDGAHRLPREGDDDLRLHRRELLGQRLKPIELTVRPTFFDDELRPFLPAQCCEAFLQGHEQVPTRLARLKPHPPDHRRPLPFLLRPPPNRPPSRPTP